MKKQFILTTVMSACLVLTSCMTSGTGGLSSLMGSSSSSTNNTEALASAGSSLLNSLLGSIMSSTLTEKSLVGTWSYQGPECRFESENLLAQAGGTIVSDNIEQKLGTYFGKVGIKQGITSFTFNSDKTFSIQSSKRTIANGTYTFDSASKTLTMKGNIGLLNQSCMVGIDGTYMYLLFDATKLMNIANTFGQTLGKQSSTVANISTLLGQNYNGMKLGFKLGK